MVEVVAGHRSCHTVQAVKEHRQLHWMTTDRLDASIHHLRMQRIWKTLNEERIVYRGNSVTTDGLFIDPAGGLSNSWTVYQADVYLLGKTDVTKTFKECLIRSINRNKDFVEEKKILHYSGKQRLSKWHSPHI